MARRCSFCGEDRRVVDRLVVGHGGVAICGDCARLAVDLSAEPETEPTGDLVLTGIGSLITNDPRHGGLLGSVEGAAVVVRNGLVTWLGRHRQLPTRYREFPELDCGGRMVAPGFVDAHHHLDCRDGDDLQLTQDRVVAEVGPSLEQGTTTVELRTQGASGPVEEVTMLSALEAAGATMPTDVVSAMGAGWEPPVRSSDYRRMVETVMIPTAARLAPYLDVVVGGPLTDTDAQSVIEVGRHHGMRPRVHADRPEALEVALDVRAVSVDGMVGLERAGPAVSEAGMVVVVVPVVPWTSGRPDPSLAMWESGVIVALGTGCVEAHVPTMPMAMAIAVHHGRVAPEQALWSATRGGALAVEEPEKGRVGLGSVADLVVLEAETAADLVAEPGRDPVWRVVKDGAPLGT